MKLTTKLEAILYIKAQPLTLDELAELAGEERPVIEDALLELMEEYAHRDSALEVIETANGFSLQLRESCHTMVTHLIPAELSTGTLRTLAAIAIKSPVLQTELIARQRRLSTRAGTCRSRFCAQTSPAGRSLFMVRSE